jgi:hypothetical protein
MVFRHNFWKPFGIVMMTKAVLLLQFIDSDAIGRMKSSWHPAHLCKKLLEARW